MAKNTSTALGRQLESLKTPQTNLFEVKRGRESFLYEYSEAAGVDCDTHYSIAIEGFEALCELDPSLERFKGTIFDYTTKDWSRTSCTRENLMKMDEELENFIWKGVAPHFLLAECHKVFEWLIYKFRVHEALPDLLISALSPYSETSLFPKLLQCMAKFKSKSHKWHFLYPSQKTGTPVPKSAFIAHGKTHSGFMSEVNRAANCSDCQPVMANCIGLWMGVLSNEPSEDIILLAIEFCIEGFKSSSKDRIMSSIAVFSFIVSKYNLAQDAITTVLKKSCQKMVKNNQLLETCIKNYLLMLVMVSRTQEVSALPTPVASLVLKYLPVIAETTECESLSSLIVSSLDTESETYHDDIMGCCVQLKRIPKRLVPAIEKSVFKKWSSTSDPDERAVVVAFLLKLQVSTGQNKIAEILNQLLNEGIFFPELINLLTTVVRSDGKKERPVFDPIKDNWKAVLLLLEHFHKPHKFIYSTIVMETCFTLLKESNLIETGSDYFRKSLLSVINNCMNQEDIDESTFDVSLLLEALKHLRHESSHKECYALLTKIMSGANSGKNREEMAKKLAISFTFIGSNLSRCDDEFSLRMLNETIDRLVPLLVSKERINTRSKSGETAAVQSPEEVSSLLDIFIDTLPDIPNHRRLDIFRRILGLAADSKWSALTIVKLVEANFGPGRPDNTGLNFSVELLPYLPPDHHAVIMDTFIDLMAKKSNSLIVNVYGMELTQTEEFKVKMVRFMLGVAPESSKLTINVPSIVRALSELLPSLVVSFDDETRKRVENFLLLAIEKFMDGMAAKDVLIASNVLLAKESSSYKERALFCLNKLLRNDHLVLDKDDVELVVQMCVCVGTTISLSDFNSDDSATKLIFIKLAASVCIRADHRPKILKSLTNKCMKCYQKSSHCEESSSVEGKPVEPMVNTANIKLVVASANACLELVNLFNDRKLMDSLLNIVVNNLSSTNHIIRLSSTKILRRLIVTDSDDGKNNALKLIDPNLRNLILLKVHESNMEEDPVSKNKSVVRQFNQDRKEIIDTLTASIKQE